MGFSFVTEYNSMAAEMHFVQNGRFKVLDRMRHGDRRTKARDCREICAMYGPVQN